MPLYVDDARNRYGPMLLSHMMADTSGELERARQELGIPPSSIHHPDSPDEHMDLSQAKRREAIARLGARPVSSRCLVALRRLRREAARAETNPPETP